MVLSNAFSDHSVSGIVSRQVVFGFSPTKLRGPSPKKVLGGGAPFDFGFGRKTEENPVTFAQRTPFDRGSKWKPEKPTHVQSDVGLPF